jgi:hypothetical protein
VTTLFALPPSICLVGLKVREVRGERRARGGKKKEMNACVSRLIVVSRQGEMVLLFLCNPVVLTFAVCSPLLIGEEDDEDARGRSP